MPISSDDAKMTLDFTYQYENKDGSIGQNMYIRYYISEEYGPTIAISADQEKYVGYPAEMFREIVEFIDAQLGRNRGKQKIIAQDEIKAEQNNFNPSSLPMPNIGRTQENKSTANDSTNVNATNDEPVQSFNGSPATETVNDTEIKKNTDNKEQELDDYTEEEIQAMWESRQEASQKAKESQKSIKPNHVVTEDEDG